MENDSRSELFGSAAELPSLARGLVLTGDLSLEKRERVIPKNLTIKSSEFNESWRRKLMEKVVDEPEEVSLQAERETMEVQVPLDDHASVKERFLAAAALYNAWATALIDCIDRYFYGNTKSEVEAVVIGIRERTKEILSQNRERTLLLADLWGFCVDLDENLPRMMEEEILSKRVEEACERWKEKGQARLNALVEEEHARSMGNLTAAERAGVEDDLEKKLEQALLEQAQQEEEDEEEMANEKEEDEENDNEEGEYEEPDTVHQNTPSTPSESGAVIAQGGLLSPHSLEEMEKQGHELQMERERLAREREEMRAQQGTPLLRRMSTQLEIERVKALERAVQIAESPEVIAQSLAFVAAAEKQENLTAREEIEALASQNEGRVHRLQELSQAEGADEKTTAEHRKEIERLKLEGETLQHRMARLQEERLAAEQVAQSSTRKELEELREKQKGRTKKKATEVLSPEEKAAQHAQHRDEIERLRVERQTMTHKLGSELLERANDEKAGLGELDGEGSSRGGAGEVAKRFLHEAAEREREKMAALLSRLEAEEADEPQQRAEVGNLLALLEQRAAEEERAKLAFDSRVQEMEKKRALRNRQRDDQMSLRAKREEEKRREQEEESRFQAERQRKLDEKRMLREIKAKSAKGEVPKFKIAVLGPRSGKSALVKRFVENSFDEQSVNTHIDQTLDKPYVTKSGEACMLQLLDTTGMEEFAEFRVGWFQSCQGFVAVFDLTRKASRSFKKLRIFGEAIKKAKNVSDLTTVPIVLVGTKEDLFEKRKVKAGEALAFAKEWGAKYVEVSAKSGENCIPAFETLLAALLKK